MTTSYDNILTFGEYQEETAKTAIYPGQGELLGLTYVALGLGEAGEVQGKVKKILRDSGGVITNETRNAIAGEIGDLLWYAAQACSELNLDMGIVAAHNLSKLSDRANRGVLGGSGDNR